MSTFKISKLAHDAGLSTNVVRDYVLRGLLHPASRTQSGHHLFDDHSLERLHFVRSLFEAGIGLNELTRLCHALDDGETPPPKPWNVCEGALPPGAQHYPRWTCG